MDTIWNQIGRGVKRAIEATPGLEAVGKGSEALPIAGAATVADPALSYLSTGYTPRNFIGGIGAPTPEAPPVVAEQGKAAYVPTSPVIKPGDKGGMSLAEKYNGDWYAAMADPAVTDEQFKKFADANKWSGIKYKEKDGKLERTIDKSLERSTKKEPKSYADLISYDLRKGADSHGVGSEDLKTPVGIMKLAAALGKKKDANGEESTDLDAGINAIHKNFPGILEKAGMKAPEQLPPGHMKLSDGSLAVRNKQTGKWELSK